MELIELYRQVQRWVDTILRVDDFVMRHRLIMERLSELSAPDLAEALHYILRRAEMGRRSCQDILQFLQDIDPLVQANGRPYFSDVYSHARKRGYENVVHFLRRPKSKPGLKLDFLPDPDQLVNEITLGQRRALAMSLDRTVIERLMFDPDPMVIRQLLQNPRMTLFMVVRIAARRPTKPPVLMEIFHSPRWIVHYDVKVTLARNPYTPPDISLRLLSALRVQDLLEVAADTALLADIRQVARDLVQNR